LKTRRERAGGTEGGQPVLGAARGAGGGAEGAHQEVEPASGDDRVPCEVVDLPRARAAQPRGGPGPRRRPAPRVSP